MFSFYHVIIVDVAYTCKKILDIPGQSESNYDALFQMGFASMRLGDYISAAEHLLKANCIDNRQVALRLAMLDLRIIFIGKGYRKRSRCETFQEQRRVATRTSDSPERA
jgi:hypothetical protein